jgi:S-formylglutathione hydrolase FrmB
MLTRLTIGASILALASVLLLMLMGAPQARADAPNFTSGNGITVNKRTSNGRLIDLTVKSSAVQGTQTLLVVLPTNYYANPGKRYPVVYMLHGALVTNPYVWIAGAGRAMQISDNKNVILVLPYGGAKGWYTNWVNAAQYTPQRWYDYHTSQLVPFIDRNIRTIARRDGRAIVGLSMGGFGAIHYAQYRPDLYRYVAAYSGAVDLENAAISGTIFAEETGMVGGSGPPAPPGSIFGNLSPGFNQHAQALNPVNPANVKKLKGLRVDLYSGQGNLQTNLGGGLIESQVKPANDLLASRLAQNGVDYWYSIDHPRNLGWGCDDNHSQECWNAYFADSLPRMLNILAKS